MVNEAASKSSDRATHQQSPGDILVDMGRITREQFLKARETQASEGSKLTTVLVDQGLVTQDEIAMALSLYLDVPLIDLKRHEVHSDAVKLIPESTARKYNLVPLDVVADTLVVVNRLHQVSGRDQWTPGLDERPGGES